MIDGILLACGTITPIALISIKIYLKLLSKYPL